MRLQRDRVGLTQGQLAERAQTNRSAVAHLEQGLRLPTSDVTVRVCTILELPALLWSGFVPRSSSFAVAVRCHCLTDLASASGSGTGDKRDKDKLRLLRAVQQGERWVGKKGPADPYVAVARRLRRDFPELFLGRTFVPVPSAKGQANSTLVEALVSEGVGCRSATLLGRGEGKARGREQGSVMDSLARLEPRVEGHLPPGIVLVDDVVEHGTTLIACAALLAELGWHGEVDALLLASIRGRGEEPREHHELVLGWDREAPLPARTQTAPPCGQ
ncbi:MAG: helix-turn-helix domain-containing protein [Myxococcales bacterium]|nr:helix-turn-helix domain-containing protein [Myxococcales bacterium]